MTIPAQRDRDALHAQAGAFILVYDLYMDAHETIRHISMVQE